MTWDPTYYLLFYSFIVSYNEIYAITGLPFWRAPKRKVYAVKEEDFQSLANTDSDSDGDERDVAPRAPAKRMKLFQNEFKTKMSEMKRDIKQLIENTVPSPIRDELRGLL